MAKRYRILLIAEQANPEWVSVPLVGWSLARALARAHDVHIVTQVRNRDAFLRAGMEEGRDFTAINSEAVAKPIYNIGHWLSGGSGRSWTTITAFQSLSYYYFERLVWQQFGSKIRGGAFDLVHRITPLSPTTPSLSLPRRCAAAGVPFVVGPLNGGVPWPRAFDSVRRAEREWLSYVRNAYKLLPGYRAMRRKAGAIIVGSQATHEQMPAYTHDRLFYIPENAIDPTRFDVRRQRRASVPIHVLFVGRLVPYKGADMLIEAAAALIKANQVQLTIIGDGPERQRLERMVSEQQLADGVKFAGFVPHDQIANHMANADVLGFPSIREFGGGVVLEAMAVGLPPMVVNYAGPAELVTSQTGYAIPLGSRDQIVAAYKQKLQDIVQDPGQLDQRSDASIKRVQHYFTWDAKVKQIEAIYQWLADPSQPRPQVTMPFADVA